MKIGRQGDGGGRPRIETIDDLQNCKIDGDFLVKFDILKNFDYKKEIELQNYIIENIDMFCRDILDDDLISFETEYQFEKQNYFSQRKIRADLYLKCKKQDYIVELKNPTHKSENRAAIGQLLNYSLQFLDSKKRQLVLITTLYDYDTEKVIKKYNLPIRYIYFSKDKILEFLKEND